MQEAADLLGLDARADDRFPHEFSGGQRQRIGLARCELSGGCLLSFSRF